MGGCRCSYRNCKVRSDGQTHMFHFPVFDKMRCHQWITNSLKPNFLNLKLSQLRNRVICQHHFRDDNFMNFLLDKLKNDAVPTEDGPYCVPDPAQAMVFVENDKPAIPINADDIENEKLNSVEKKAHSSVKYGDFLISDVTELFNSSHNNIDSPDSMKASLRHVKNKSMLASNVLDSKYKSKNHEDIHNYTINYSNNEQVKATKMLSSQKATPNPVAILLEEPSTINEPLKTVGITKSESHSSPAVNPDKVVKILAEETISEPVVVKGELQPISPSMIIRPHNRKILNNTCKQINWDTKSMIRNEESSINISFQASNNTNPPEQTIILKVLPIEYAPGHANSFNKDNQNILINTNVDKESQVIDISNIEYQKNLNDCTQKQNEAPLEQAFLNCMLETAQKLEPEYNFKVEEKPPLSKSAGKSLLKSKVTPAKLAAIEEKRKFNLKLRDVITSCLDNLDDQNEIIDNKISPEKKRIQQNRLSKAPSPVSTQGGIVAYLEARLQRMEDTLLNKIDHNTQRINELKRTIKPSFNARHANTQTYLNHMSEESQKQHLYKEISMFLSPSANIKIYEELFLGKTSSDELETIPRKLRRRR